MNQRQILHSLLKTERPLVMPDAYDALSARLIQNAGFKAVQCSGFSMALATGCKSEDELSFKRNLQITRDIIRSVNIPVMADGEDGFGPPEKVVQPIKSFASIGGQSTVFYGLGLTVDISKSYLAVFIGDDVLFADHAFVQVLGKVFDGSGAFADLPTVDDPLTRGRWNGKTALAQFR